MAEFYFKSSTGFNELLELFFSLVFAMATEFKVLRLICTGIQDTGTVRYVLTGGILSSFGPVFM